MQNNTVFSIAIYVYSENNPLWFDKAFASIFEHSN